MVKISTPWKISLGIFLIPLIILIIGEFLWQDIFHINTMPENENSSIELLWLVTIIINIVFITKFTNIPYIKRDSRAIYLIYIGVISAFILGTYIDIYNYFIFHTIIKFHLSGIWMILLCVITTIKLIYKSPKALLYIRLSSFLFVLLFLITFIVNIIHTNFYIDIQLKWPFILNFATVFDHFFHVGFQIFILGVAIYIFLKSTVLDDIPLKELPRPSNEHYFLGCIIIFIFLICLNSYIKIDNLNEIKNKEMPTLNTSSKHEEN